MAPDAGGSVEWLEYFMEFLLDQLKTNNNYELIQSYLGLFLKVSCNVVTMKVVKVYSLIHIHTIMYGVGR